MQNILVIWPSQQTFHNIFEAMTCLFFNIIHRIFKKKWSLMTLRFTTNTVHRLLDLENEGIMILKHNGHPSPKTLHIPQTLKTGKISPIMFSYPTPSIIQEISCRENAKQSTFSVKHRIWYSEGFTSVSVFWDMTHCEASGSFSRVKRTKKDDSWSN